MTAIPNDRKIRKEQITGVVKELQEGSNITIDATDPERPIISAIGGGGGGVESVTGDGVDNTDPDNPVIEASEFINILSEVSLLDDGGAATYTFVSSNNRAGIRKRSDGTTTLYVRLENIQTTGTPSGTLRFTWSTETSSTTLRGVAMITEFYGSDLADAGTYVPVVISTGVIQFYPNTNWGSGSRAQGVTFTNGRLKFVVDLIV